MKLCPPIPALIISSLLSFPLSLANLALAGEQVAGYQIPSSPLAALVEQAKQNKVLLSPDGFWLLSLSPQGAPTVKQLAQPMMRLGGTEIDSHGHLPGKLPTLYDELSLRRASDMQRQSIPGLSALMPVMAPKFSPDGKTLALISLATDQPRLQLIELASGKVQEQDLRLNFSLGVNYRWLPDSSALLLPLVVGEHGQAPSSQSAIPGMPAIKESQPNQVAKRTHRNLLKNPADHQAFAQQVLSQLALLSTEGELRPLGSPVFLLDADASPDGRFILVEQLTEPFSNRVPYRGFAKRFEVMSLTSGDALYRVRVPGSDAERDDADMPGPAPRLFHWQGEANLVWVEGHRSEAKRSKTQETDAPANDAAVHESSDAQKAEASFRDTLYTLSPPFTVSAKVLGQTQWPISAINWRDDGKALISQIRRSKQLIKVSLLSPATANTATAWQDWYQISSKDKYQDPGTLVRDPVTHLVATRNGAMYHYGDGHSDDGMRPFLATSKAGEARSLLWQSAPSAFERVVALESLSPLQLLVSQETPLQPPRLYRVWPESGKREPLIPLAKRQPALEGIQKEHIQFSRADGQPLSGTLYLPANYRHGDGPLPVLIWAYPREYKNAEVAAQVDFNPLSYPRLSPLSAPAMVAAGFAVFDRVSMPIIGVGKNKPNDTFLAQLVANAEAAVKVLTDRGIAEPGRIAVGGHSYGAFMVANLLAHTDLFATGIARSGAYNRSLTPFGFQNERRNYWEAQALYQQMSPFNVADKINEPLLLIHGEADANSGTYPMQSSRLFDAVSTLGGQARLVTLPFEGHSYRARESQLHVLWEQEAWLRSHLSPKETTAAAAAQPL
ncbi:glutamyl peptidase. Serine peptidase. MEROPS family S09D [Shewanella amazonensis SB2B]|uniref:Glutamyl peptidase. Serine peptidase. MEROPS family S09D n=1 Tax=Shewanella amazonensis (strain ATCC BAA-1098 / SB2B) TaxID=326297 RepID=A1S3U7_SHEAM|nr:prolyl oligopeptidase family serine peptidase [Shewanella amazonensis]ABL99053.1 glutamyl peptidase. Serine peptidase. MEROPS family S09D [Shewanella amazonensis SB2B]